MRLSRPEPPVQRAAHRPCRACQVPSQGERHVAFSLYFLSSFRCTGQSKTPKIVALFSLSSHLAIFPFGHFIPRRGAAGLFGASFRAIFPGERRPRARAVWGERGDPGPSSSSRSPGGARKATPGSLAVVVCASLLAVRRTPAPPWGSRFSSAACCVSGRGRLPPKSRVPVSRESGVCASSAFSVFSWLSSIAPRPACVCVRARARACVWWCARACCEKRRATPVVSFSLMSSSFNVHRLRFFFFFF